MSIERHGLQPSLRTALAASFVALVAGAYGLLLAGRALYFASFFLAERFELVQLVNIGLIYSLPALAAGVFLGRSYPRWGWILGLLASWMATADLAVASAIRYAALAPAAAIAG
jgi:hypothetical protein